METAPEYLGASVLDVEDRRELELFEDCVLFELLPSDFEADASCPELPRLRSSLGTIVPPRDLLPESLSRRTSGI